MVLLMLNERLLRGRPLHLDGLQTRRENGDTTSLETSAPRAIADVGEAWPSRSGRTRFHGGHETGAFPSVSEWLVV